MSFPISNVIFTSGNTANYGNEVTSANVMLSNGSSITEIPSPNGFGEALVLTPFGPTATQQLVIYPTNAEGDHVHLTSGDLTQTSIFLGSDHQYIRTLTDGGMTIGTNVTFPDTPGNGNQWEFDVVGNVSAPGAINFSVSNASIQSIGPVLQISGNAQSNYNTLDLGVNGGDTFLSANANVNMQTGIGGTNYVWSFGVDGELHLPTGGRIGTAGKGWTGIDGGNGNPLSLTSLYSSGMYSSCITLNPDGSLYIATYGDGTGQQSNWNFSNANLITTGNSTITTANATSGLGGNSITIQAGASDTVTFNGNPGGDLTLVGGYGSFGDGGGGPGGNVNILGGGSSDSTPGNVNISSGSNVNIKTYMGNGLAGVWTFDNTGALTIAGNINGDGASPAPSLNGFDSVNALTFSAGGNVTASNFITSGASGNITGANVISATTFTAIGNVYGAGFAGDGTNLANVSAIQLGTSSGAYSSQLTIDPYLNFNFIQNTNGVGNIVGYMGFDTGNDLYVQSEYGNIIFTTFQQNGGGNPITFGANSSISTVGNVYASEFITPYSTLNNGLSTTGNVVANNISLTSGQIQSGITTNVPDGINAIYAGVTTRMDVFAFPFATTTRGQLTISGITTPTEANGTWYYQSTANNTFEIFTDVNCTQTVDSTSWAAYAGGGVVSIVENLPTGNIVLNANGFLSTFTDNGQLVLPVSLNTDTIIGPVSNDQITFSSSSLSISAVYSGAVQLSAGAGGTANGGIWTFGNGIEISPVGPVSKLPAPTGGARSFVSDSTVAPTGNFGIPVVGGGGNTVPVWADGTMWYIG